MFAFAANTFEGTTFIFMKHGTISQIFFEAFRGIVHNFKHLDQLFTRYFFLVTSMRNMLQLLINVTKAFGILERATFFELWTFLDCCSEILFGYF